MSTDPSPLSPAPVSRPFFFMQVLLLPASPHMPTDFVDRKDLIDALTDTDRWYLDLVPARGGMGFALMLLYDVLATTAEMSLSALKYLANLFELYRGPLNSSVRKGAMLHVFD